MGLFDDVLGPKPARGGLFDDVLAKPAIAPGVDDFTRSLIGSGPIAAAPLSPASVNDTRDAIGLAPVPESEPGNLLELAARGVIAVPDLAGNLVDLPGNVADALVRAAGGNPDGLITNELLRRGTGAVSDVLRSTAREADAVGFGAPSVTGADAVAAVNPMADGSLGDRAGTIGTLIAEQALRSAPEMAAAVASLPAYIAARSNAIAEERAENDERADVSLADLLIGGGAATVEGTLERFTTGRLLPGGSAVVPPGLLPAAGRVAKEVAVQAPLGGVEELAAYAGENLGTERGANATEALETFVTGALAEGGLGAGAQVAKEAVAAAVRRGAAPAPVAPPLAAPAAPAPNLGDLAPEATDDLDALLTRNLPPEIVEAARVALGDLDTEPAPPAAAPPAATLPVTPAAQPTPPQPDTPRAPEPAEPAATPPEPRAPVPATPTPAQAGQAPAEQSAPVSVGADLTERRAGPATGRGAAGARAPQAGEVAETSPEFLQNAWATRNDDLGRRYAEARSALRAAEAPLREARQEAQSRLPAGYKTIPHPARGIPDGVALQDEDGNDIAYPLSPAEAVERAWRHAGRDDRFADVEVMEQRMAPELDALRAEVADAEAALDRNGPSPMGPTWERESQERADAEKKARETAAKAARTRESNRAAKERGRPLPTSPAADDTPDPPLSIRYGNQNLAPRGEPLESDDGAELTDADLTPAERAAFERQSAAMRGDTGDTELQGELARMSREQGAEDAGRLGLRAAVEGAVGSSPVTYLRGYDGLPDNLRTSVERRNSMGRRGRTAGLYDPATGTTYVFTDVVSTPARAAFTAAHEIAGHHGLRRLLGDDLDRALELALQNPTVARLADEIASQRKLRPSDRLLAAEESLAELAAAVRTGDYGHIADRYGVEVPPGIRARVRAAIENFLRRLKALLTRKGMAFTDEQVRELLENAWQAVDGRADATGDALQSTAQDQTETAAFRRWFGDSKVVDADGKPLVVYHGTTKSFDRFDHKMRSGLGGKAGFWFASDAGALDTFTRERMVGDAPNVMPVYLSIQKPAAFDGHAGFVAAVNERNGATVEARIKSLRAALIRSGHDGIVIRNSDTDGGVMRDDWVAFEPTQIKSATANRGTFDPDSPSILESVEGAQQRAEQRRNEAAGTLPVSRGTPGWNYDENVWDGRNGQAKRTRMDLQDKMIGWRDVQNQIAEQVGAAIPDAQNVYRLENLMHGRVSEGIDRIEREQVEPLLDAMRKAGVTPEVLEDYLYALHARERNARIAEINPAMPDGGSGMTNAQAERILAGADRAKLDPLASRVAAITRANRRRLLQNGLITQDAFDAMEAQYEHYVPLRGRPDPEEADGGTGTGRGLDTRSKPVKQALGRRSRARNILGEVIGDAQRSVILAEKARVGRAVMRLVLANPNPDLWTVEPVQTERALDANGEVYERVVNDWSDPSVVAFRHRGQVYRVQVNQPELATALNNVGVDQLGAVTRAAGQVNRYFSAILTKYNPAFVPVNATRDALFGLTGLAVEHGEGVALQAALSYLPAATAATKHAAGKGGDGEWDRWAREFAEAGGKTGYVSMPSVEDLQRSVARVSMTGPVANVTRAVRPIMDAVGILNDGVENALRLSAYATLRKRGMSAEAAAEYAKNLTVNFNRKGLSGSKLNAWFLFYNAATQGAKRTGDLLRRPKTYAYLGTLAAMQAVATMAAMGMEDEEGEPLWNKVPDHVKRRNLVIVLPASGEYESTPTVITIPMPYGFNLFTYTAGRTVSEVVNRKRGDKSHTSSAAKITADLLGAASESFMPVPIGDGALGMLPTVARIPVNVQVNMDDFGRPIRKDDAYAKSDVPRASMGRPDTLEMFKLSATGLNRIGGGDELTPPPLSWFDRSPDDMEYLLKELTGGAGKFVIDTATVGQKITGGEFAQEASAKDVPITNRFVTNIDNEAAQQSLFYDRREYVERGLKRVRIAFERDGPEAAEDLLKATPELKGAGFKRRKKTTDKGEAGDVILVDGRPQIVVTDPDAVYGRYKAATEVMSGRNEAVEEAFSNVPASLLPTQETRLRDAEIRSQNRIRTAAQREFSEAWVRDVVGTAE